MASKKRKKAENKDKKKGISLKLILFAVFIIGILILFLPTTFLLVVGMLPTLVAAIVDQQPGKNKTFTIGAMNFAGCFPYLLGLWTQSNSMPVTLGYLSSPNTIIVMYGAAAAGYIINMLVTMGVASIMIQSAKTRIKKIGEEKKALEKRWGKKVNGQIELDPSGFPVTKNTEEDA